MKFLQTIIILIFSFSTVFSQITRQTTTYSGLDGNYLMGKIKYESKAYSDNYEKDRLEGIELLKISVENGLHEAQFYLGKIYLQDPLIHNYKKGVELLRLAALQNNQDAIKLLDKLNEDYEAPFDFQKNKKWILLGLFIHFIISLFIQSRIFKTRQINKKLITRLIIWTMPIMGGLIELLRLKRV